MNLRELGIDNEAAAKMLVEQKKLANELMKSRIPTLKREVRLLLEKEASRR